MIDRAWQTFDSATIDAQPTPVACALAELQAADQSLVALWRACDLIELLLRVTVTILIAELGAREGSREQATAMLRKSAFNYRAPTLGMWKGLLTVLLNDTEPRLTAVPELTAKEARAARARFAEFFDGPGGAKGGVESPRYERSFTGLRNRLAHGAGLTHEAADHLLQIWHGPIRRFIDSQLAWLATFGFRGRSAEPGGASYRIHGLQPRALPAPAAPSGEEEVWVERDALQLRLWPLMIFGVPRVPPKTVKVTAVQVYSNQDGNDDQTRIFYTPYLHAPAGRAPEVIYWSQGDDRARDDLVARFRPAAVDSGALMARGATAVFADEVRAEGRRMMGCRDALRATLAALEKRRGSALWLHGPAGVGKSMLMAKVATRLIEDDKALVVLYRFRYADPRCSADLFLQLVLQTLNTNQRSPSLLPIGALDDERRDREGRRERTRAAIDERLARITRSGRDVIFVVDGLDEIAAIDREFLADVLAPLLAARASQRGQVTWLLAGRSELTTTLVQAGATELDFDGAPSIPGLRETDVWAMLLDRIGGARDDLFKGTDPEHDLKELAPIAATPHVLEALARGEVPQELLEVVWPRVQRAPSDRRPRAVPLSRPGADATAERLWLIDDDEDSTMYFAAHTPGSASVGLRESRLHSPFIDSIVERSRESESGADGERKCLALYVKYVIDDILLGQVGHTNRGALDPDWLPDGLEHYYDAMTKRLGIGGVSKLLTPVVYYLATAREPLDDQALQLLLADDLPRRAAPADRAAMVRDALDSLRSVLRHNTRIEDGRRAWTLYHHSYREYLLRHDGARSTGDRASSYAADWLDDARHGWARRCAEAASAGLDSVAALAGYVSRHGIFHLHEAGDFAHALRLWTRLSSGEAGTALSAGALRDQTALLAAALDRSTQPLDDAAAAAARADALRAIDPDDLSSLIASTYETGFNVAAIRILIEYHADEWERISAHLITPFDIVFRHDVGDAYAGIWAAAAGDAKTRWMRIIEEMAADAGNDYRREIAGYALKHIYDESATCAEARPDLIRRYASGPSIVDRMVAGELLLTLAVRGHAVDGWVTDQSFWHPHWDYLQCDIDALRVLAADDVAALAAQTSDAALADGARDFIATERLRETLRRQEALTRSPHVNALLGSAAEQFEARGELDDPGFVDELAHLLDGAQRGIAVEFIRLLASHPLWNVTEEVSTVLRTLVSRRPHLGAIVKRLLTDASWRVRYCAVDAAYNIGAFDNHALFREALLENAAFGHCRVRGICADDLLGWLRLGSQAERRRILHDPAILRVLGGWLESADDSWLLEYVYLTFRFLRDNDPGLDLPEVRALLAGPRSRYLVTDDRPFYELEHGSFLRHIDLARAAAVRQAR